MNTLRILGVVCVLTFTVITSPVNAALVVPKNLNPGDTYHVIFVTSGITDATSADITDYDAFVQSEADAAGIGAGIGINWFALGSTYTVNAKDHLSPLFSSATDIPIYNQLGVIVSAGFNGLWDSSLDRPVVVNEFGVANTNDGVYTGTRPDGVREINNYLGWAGAREGPSAYYGLASSSGTAWLVAGSENTGNQMHLYAISEAIIVSTPVPAAVWLLGSGLMGLVGMAIRKVKSRHTSISF